MMVCQQCGRELPQGASKRQKYCAECAAKRRTMLRNIRIKSPNPFKTCLRCGEPLPPGCSASRQYCDECAKKRNIELTMARQRKKDKRARSQQEAEKTAADKAFCRECEYCGMSEYGTNLCDYLLKTGHRRGCKAGSKCDKRVRRSA